MSMQNKRKCSQASKQESLKPPLGVLALQSYIKSLPNS